MAQGDPSNFGPQTAAPAKSPRAGLFVSCLVDMFRPTIGFTTLKLLDNGPSAMLGTEFQDMLRCIRCAYGWVYPGPMGSVLTPSLIGVEEAGHLPNASTFCGRCESVCTMRIPLPKVMRHYRQHEHKKGLSPQKTRAGLSVWSYFATRPKLYRFATRLASGLLGRLGKVNGRLTSLPLADGWTSVRDVPAPKGRTFHDLYRERQAAKGGLV